MAEQPILIAGGGIGGFAAALALSRKGRAVTLLEQAPEFGEVGAGIQIGPNVFKMFEVLGLTEAILDVAVLPEYLVMRDGLSGDEIVRMPVGSEAFRERYTYPYGVIYRPDLHNALIDACANEPLVTTQVSQTVTGFEDSGEGVRVFTEEGATHEGAALIGADGLWSKVRGEIVGDGAPRVSGHIAYRAVLKTEEVPAHIRQDNVVLWAGPKTHLVHYPLHRGEIYNLVAVFHSDRYEEGWDSFGDPEELRKRFAGEHEDVLTMLDKIESWRMWVLCDREPVRNWSRGRATLLGDAAHPMLQYLAQGACMAIEDGVCLATRVAANGDDFETAFQEYQGLRYLRTARVQLTARMFGDIYHAADATADLRNTMLGAIDQSKPGEGMAWLYEGLDETGAQQFKLGA
ncbi:MAG: 3-hydroxybenzoate 6-monooxygenase [Alphaproteobacteria bacterium]|nr:3-hydroxybenzoate 6-monooxygenase [Alphaproteobacteria bacterium]